MLDTLTRAFASGILMDVKRYNITLYKKMFFALKNLLVFSKYIYRADNLV
ncbi:hypothetical protein L21SP3_01046 [Sedimentisphaera cyanobacteriorum]|uniref:Uncharacterized protein n=1 Tax=Sedimentisphaera cyanobacteriorum TaxID=1940790 RepID=A0A1Q2HPN8_9BACT|nr:hypothetical protein L21SP3_01046 [Sedimentisphaera cyanobacteriorum]